MPLSDFTSSRRQFVRSLTALGLSLPVSDFAEPAVAATPLPTNKHSLCVFSKHLQWLNVPDMARAAADLGFEGVDLTVRRGGHVDPDQVVTELPKAVEAIRKVGLDVPMIATNIIDPAAPATELILKTASELGIRYYRTDWLSYDPVLGVARSLDRYRPRFRQLATLNQRYNIHGAYQNHFGTGVGAAVWDIWELIRDLDPRWMGCQYDIKHATVEGAYSWGNGLNLLQKHIRCLDIKDAIWTKKDGRWQPQLVPLGEGMVDYKHFLSLLKQYGIWGPMSLHFEYDLGGAESGKTQLTVPKNVVLTAMKRDLETLRKLLAGV